MDSLMRRLAGASVLGAVLTCSSTAFAQSQPPQAPPPASESVYRPAMTTASGTTGLWYVPTSEVLPHKKWSGSLFRTNVDDGQGFTDISKFPVTFAVGVGGRAELFGSWALVTRIDRDTVPLFFEGVNEDGTGGGIVVDHPRVPQGWSGNKLGDLWLGGKVSLLPPQSTKPFGVAVRGMVKVPVGDEESGASSGATDFQVDGIVSGYNQWVEASGTFGFLTRGNPEGYDLTNGLRWGFGLSTPQKRDSRFRLTAELFGEQYFDDEVTAPAGLFGTDGSPVPITTSVKAPTLLLLGANYQAPNGFFFGVGTHVERPHERPRQGRPGRLLR